MSTIRVVLHSQFAGAKFRPVSWRAITDDGFELKGYGVEVRPLNARRYKLCAVHGDTIPFPSEKQAKDWCKAADLEASNMLMNQNMRKG